MSIQLDAARLLLHHAADVPAGTFPDVRLVAQAKIFAAETANRVTNDALQLFGSAGCSREMPLERHVRDARMFSIAVGTAQVLRTQVGCPACDSRTPYFCSGASVQPPAA